MDREDTFCLQCSSKLKQTKGHRQKRFVVISAEWNIGKITRKSNVNQIILLNVLIVTITLTYKSLNRKYCSRDCFIKNKVERIGYGQRHDQLS